MADGERQLFRASADVLLIRDGKVLLGRRKDTGFGDGMYGIPGGHLEAGETLLQTAIREAQEECGVSIQPADISFAHALHHHSANVYIQFFFIASTWVGDPHICEPDRCDDMQWFPLDALPENILPHIRQVIECIGKKISYSEFGF